MDNFVKLMDMAQWAMEKAIKKNPALALEMEKQLKHVRYSKEHPEEAKQDHIKETTAGFMTAWMVNYPDLEFFHQVIVKLRHVSQETR